MQDDDEVGGMAGEEDDMGMESDEELETEEEPV